MRTQFAVTESSLRLMSRIGTVASGIVVAGDPANSGRLVPIALIVAGIVALRLFSAA